MLNRIPVSEKSKQKKLKAYKKVIDGLIFPRPRQIPLIFDDGIDPDNLNFLERPLRGQTAQGERICLARSETAPAGTRIEFQILVLDESLVPYIESWLNYGQLRGLGCWRNSGAGRFTYECENTGQ